MSRKTSKDKVATNKQGEKDFVRLNKYIASTGLCSRREADELIGQGKVKVNGKVVEELGTKVKEGDKVEYKGKVLQQEKLQYVLLNKPKDVITTMDDPEGRKTVRDITRK
ncbi:MAG: RNA-binding S4 domain-containing protein, partial [Bacteroidales bacterium]|nr:RNA-binding S4 domain-containing protein [Bacteroidales bacterium]